MYAFIWCNKGVINLCMKDHLCCNHVWQNGYLACEKIVLKNAVKMKIMTIKFFWFYIYKSKNKNLVQRSSFKVLCQVARFVFSFVYTVSPNMITVWQKSNIKIFWPLITVNCESKNQNIQIHQLFLYFIHVAWMKWLFSMPKNFVKK